MKIERERITIKREGINSKLLLSVNQGKNELEGEEKELKIQAISHYVSSSKYLTKHLFYRLL